MIAAPENDLPACGDDDRRSSRSVAQHSGCKPEMVMIAGVDDEKRNKQAPVVGCLYVNFRVAIAIANVELLNLSREMK